jgi:hypothetical protein
LSRNKHDYHPIIMCVKLNPGENMLEWDSTGLKF